MARWRDVKKGKIKKDIKDKSELKEIDKSADFLKRVKAFITDMFMIMMPIMYITTYVILNGKEEFQASEPARWAGMIIYSIISITFWVKAGQTPGKKAYDIIIVDTKTKQKMTIFKAILRYLAFLFSAMSVIGLLVPLFRKDRKALHDLLSGTMVINVKT